MTSLCRHLSRLPTGVHVHTADADATKQFRPVGVGGVYWALDVACGKSTSVLSLRCAFAC